jgi:hypothetical protein
VVQLARLFLLALLLFVSACSTPYKPPVFVSNTGSADFNGIASYLSKDRPVDLVVVHGMCTHDASWAREAVQGIFSALGEDAGRVQLQERAVEGTGIFLYQQTLETSRGALRANAIVWSPLTTPLKSQLCFDQTNKSPTCPPEEAKKAYPYRRAMLNRTLKDTILDDCLSDAVIYQGKARDDISEQMQRAMIDTVATSGGQAKASRVAAVVPQQLPLVVVSESLGSKVAFDALYKLAKRSETAAAGERTWNRIAHIYMGANQLPILALADKRLDGTAAMLREMDAYPEDPIAALVNRRQSSMLEAKNSAPQVVAFTDPNDLLSYILVPSPNAAPYPAVDVIVSNGTTYLGLVELPNIAHLGYRKNLEVQRLIACGTTGKGCR